MNTNLHSGYTRDKLTEVTRLLLEMRENCAGGIPGGYDDPKRKGKLEALNIALDAIGRLPDWGGDRSMITCDSCGRPVSHLYPAGVQACVAGNRYSIPKGRSPGEEYLCTECYLTRVKAIAQETRRRKR